MGANTHHSCLCMFGPGPHFVEFFCGSNICGPVPLTLVSSVRDTCFVCWSVVFSTFIRTYWVDIGSKSGRYWGGYFVCNRHARCSHGTGLALHESLACPRHMPAHTIASKTALVFELGEPLDLVAGSPPRHLASPTSGPHVCRRRALALRPCLCWI
jgi:hypothetical protein